MPLNLFGAFGDSIYSRVKWDEEMKRLNIVIGAMICVLFVLPFFSSYAAEKQPPPTAAPPTATGKPPQAAPALPDLIVERVWLDDEGFINFQLKNAAQVEIPDKEHQRGMVRVTYGKNHADFSFRKTLKKRPAVDPKGLLKKPGGVVQYNTQIRVKERLTVKVLVDSTKRIAEADEQNNLSTPLMLVPGAVALKGVKEDITEKMGPKPEPGVLESVTKKELRPLERGLQVTKPNTGGERWLTGGIYDIRWEGGQRGEHVKIELWKGDRMERVIDDSVSNYGIYEWQIPDDLEEGDDYRVRVERTADWSRESDASDRVFRILRWEGPRTIRVYFPTEGETFSLNRPFNIYWHACGIGDHVRIYLVNASGPQAGMINRTIDDMADNSENAYDAHSYTGKYLLTLRDLNTSYRYKIRVAGRGAHTSTVGESGSFSVEPDIRVPFPGTYDVTIPILLPESGYGVWDAECRYYESRTNSVWPRAGDLLSYEYFECYSALHGFMGFDLSGIPRHAQIATATLHISDYSIGNRPFETLGTFSIYSITTCNYPPDSLAGEGYGHLVSSRNGPPNHPIAVTEEVRVAFNTDSRLFRVQLQFENTSGHDDHDDYIQFHSGCFLRVTYVIEY
jgi:hypothetical protein